jgi:hypothetical protein
VVEEDGLGDPQLPLVVLLCHRHPLPCGCSSAEKKEDREKIEREDRKERRKKTKGKRMGENRV